RRMRQQRSRNNRHRGILAAADRDLTLEPSAPLNTQSIEHRIKTPVKTDNPSKIRFHNPSYYNRFLAVNQERLRLFQPIVAIDAG
ncbi:MAG: hypothetical protein RR739_08455, partial [Clostridia bacterium]